MSIVLPVSLGEALDKLSILEIKLEQIHDERRLDVEKEHSLLLEQLADAKSRFNFWYKHLVNINKTIWDDQDIVRGKRAGMSDKEYVDLCDRILNMNDTRFRIKNKINSLAESNLKEQKGYAKKKALLMTHLGVGDFINHIGAIRYFSLIYDELAIVICEKQAQTVSLLLGFDAAISFITYEYIQQFCHAPDHDFMKHFAESNGYVLLGGGHWSKLKSPFRDVPYNFYRDLGLDKSVYKDYFYIPEYKEQQDYLNLILKKTNRIAFLHLIGTNRRVEYTKKKDDSIFYCDPNTNHYEPGHKYYELAQKLINLPLIYYKGVMEAAEELYLIDSSFCTFANVIDTSKVKLKTLFMGRSKEDPDTVDDYIGADILSSFTKLPYHI